MSELLVVTGPPGAGKSTVARVLVCGFESSALVNGDDFFGFLGRAAIAPWLPEAGRQNAIVTAAAAAAAGRLVIGGYMVVYDGMVGPWFLDLFRTAAEVPRLQYAVLMPTEELCVARVESRVGHGFTDIGATRHMYRQFVEARIDARHIIDGPPNDPPAIAACIQQRMADGWLLHPGP